MIIKNVKAYLDFFDFGDADVQVKDGIITRIDENIVDQSDDHILDGKGNYLCPGFIDVHTHGCVGFDTCDADIGGYHKMAQFYAQKGVTSFLFTTMTMAREDILKALRCIGEFIEQGCCPNGAYSHGVYIEGPFINEKKKGAQDANYIRLPDFSLFEEFNEACGNVIKIVIVAPEKPGANNFIEQASSVCTVSMGHSDADFHTAVNAISSGVSCATHLFNAMPPLNHRNPGVIGASLDNEIYTEIICDNIHLDGAIVRMVFKLNADKAVLISDSMRAAGLGNGEFTLGGLDVSVSDGKAILKDGTIAGSASDVLSCVKNCVQRFSIPLKQVIKAATYNPACLIRVDKITGSISVGKNADLILLDGNLDLKRVFVKGTEIKI